MKHDVPCRLKKLAPMSASGRAAAVALVLLLGILAPPSTFGATAPVVVQVNLDDTVEPVTAEYATRGISYANQIQASAILLNLSTPGGLDTSMREIISAIEASRVPVITYVAPSGHRAASAGFFILLSGDLAVMAPGTNTGAAHPVVMGGADIGKTMEGKIENDAAAYIRSIADKRGRNSKLAEEGVRESRSFTEKEALEGKLIDAIANTPPDIFAQFDGKTIKRFDGSSTTLHLAGAVLEPFEMTGRERFLSRIADPNIAFILGAVGVLCLYLEFNHPGMVAPGVVGAISLVLALYAFHLLPINYAGVLLILVALVLFILEAKTPTHGVLAIGGVIAMVVGSLILIDTPFPGGGIRLGTSLSVTLPVAVVMVFLMRIAIAARRLKVVTGDAGMIDEVGTAQTDLEPEGKIFVHGEIWEARASADLGG